MDSLSFITLETDSDFSRMSLHCSQAVYDELAKNITNNNIVALIYTWSGYILDGHKQYHICYENQIPFSIKELSFSNKNDALIWLCKHRLSSTKYLTKSMLHYCVGEYYNLERAKVNPNGCCGHNQFSPRESLYSNMVPNGTNFIASAIAEKTHIALSSVLKYARQSKAINLIFEVSPLIGRAILEEHISMTYSVLIGFSKLSKEDILGSESFIISTGSRTIILDDVYRFLDKRVTEIKKPRQKSVVKKENPIPFILPKIKFMPAPDVDAAVTSLALTIPSWINSINRASSSTDFDSISESANKNLQLQLEELHQSIISIVNRLERQ